MCSMLPPPLKVLGIDGTGETQLLTAAFQLHQARRQEGQWRKLAGFKGARRLPPPNRHPCLLLRHRC